MHDPLSKHNFNYSPLEWLDVSAEDDSLDHIACDLAKKLQSVVLPVDGDHRSRYVLKVTYHGISLQDVSRPKTKPFLLEMKELNRRSIGRDLLAKSVGRRCRTVVDATAGFGRDAFHLYFLGKSVTAIERSPVVAVMVDDAIKRLTTPSPNILLKIICDDSREWLSKCERPDVIYLDPMFPDPKSRSALATKELRILRRLVGNDEDAPYLLRVALSVASQRVVVKRPLHAPALADVPNLKYKGKSVRYDVYLTER